MHRIAEWTILGCLLGSSLAFGDHFEWNLLWIGIPLGGAIGAIIGAGITLIRRRPKQ